MEFLELVKKRYSVRKYETKKVDRAILDRCIEAARLAPSAVNSQPWHFILVDDPEKVAALAGAAATGGAINRFARQAGAIAAVVAEKPNVIAGVGGFLKKRPYYLIDIGIAAEHFCLQAAEEGIGTCMLGWFDEKAVRQSLKIPGSKRVALLITLGHPADPTARGTKQRKSVEKMSSYNSYGGGGD